jgi:hypothetical protein
MSPNCAERIGLHSLPADVLRRVIAHYSVQEGKAELNQIRESLIKSLPPPRTAINATPLLKSN